MTSIDERVVQMRFDSKGFESGVFSCLGRFICRITDAINKHDLQPNRIHTLVSRLLEHALRQHLRLGRPDFARTMLENFCLCYGGCPS